MSTSAARRAREVDEVTPERADGDVALTLARITILDGRSATIDLGGRSAEADLDPSVETIVAQTAWARGERLVVTRVGQRYTIVGALRTTVTPGVDDADEITIRAKRIAVLAAHEIAMVAGATSFAMRAIGHVETIAENLTTRANGVHKLVGRILRLN